MTKRPRCACGAALNADQADCDGDGEGDICTIAGDGTNPAKCVNQASCSSLISVLHIAASDRCRSSMSGESGPRERSTQIAGGSMRVRLRTRDGLAIA